VASREHEAIASVPVRIARIVPHEASEEQVPDRRHTHRQSWMPRVGLLHGVNRQDSDRIDA